MGVVVVVEVGVALVGVKSQWRIANETAPLKRLTNVRKRAANTAGWPIIYAF